MINNKKSRKEWNAMKHEDYLAISLVASFWKFYYIEGLVSILNKLPCINKFLITLISNVFLSELVPMYLVKTQSSGRYFLRGLYTWLANIGTDYVYEDVHKITREIVASSLDLYVMPNTTHIYSSSKCERFFQQIYYFWFYHPLQLLPLRKLAWMMLNVDSLPRTESKEK